MELGVDRHDFVVIPWAFSVFEGSRLLNSFSAGRQAENSGKQREQLTREWRSESKLHCRMATASTPAEECGQQSHTSAHKVIAVSTVQSKS
jgi:hypothetical protein